MKRFAAAVIAVAAAACNAAASAPPQVSPETAPPPPAQTGGRAVIPLTLPSGKVLQTEVMVKDEDRAMGLMFRPSLPLDHGMLFLFDEPDFHGIWMKNCKFPIDILWLDEEKKVVHLDEAVPPCTAKEDKNCAVYYPLRRASFVV